MKSNKPAAIIFTYDKEFEMACYNAKRLVALGFTVYIVDDANAPHKDEAGIDRTNPDIIHWMSDFNRNGNLNGYACVQGMPTIFARVSRKHSVIVKVDSDTIITSKLLERVAAIQQREAVGEIPFWFIGHEMQYPTGEEQVGGACYAMNDKALEVLINAAAQLPDDGSRYPEDRTIAKLMRLWRVTRDLHHLGWYDHKTGATNWTKRSLFVHFGYGGLANNFAKLQKFAPALTGEI